MLASAVSGASSLSRPFPGGALGGTRSGNPSTSGGDNNNGNGSSSADFVLVASSSPSSVRLLWWSSSSNRRRGRSSHVCMNLRRASLGVPRATTNADKIETPAPAPAPAAPVTEDVKVDRVSYNSQSHVQVPLNLQCLHVADADGLPSAFGTLSLEHLRRSFYCWDWHFALCVPPVPRLPGTRRPKQ